MILITGMHRSGTSLVARLCHEAGADLGDPDTFLAANRWNPDGYYEQKAFIDLNSRLINGPFWKFAYFFPPRTDTIRKRAARHATRIRELDEQFRGVAVKEPRFSLTLPAWLEHGARVERLIFCIRDPIGVARSLKRRNHITLGLGLKLWDLHNRVLLEASEDIPRHLLDYANLLRAERFNNEAGPALAFLGMDKTEPELDALREKCVRATGKKASGRDYAYPEPVAETWARLQQLHAAQKPCGA
mgnify:CR=1 FL=1